MSKPVKNLTKKTYQAKFDEIDSAVLIEVRGVKSNQNNALRQNLADKGIKVTVVKNTLAKAVWSGTALEGLNDLVNGACAIAYGGDSVVTVARELIEQAKAIEAIQFKGAIMEGNVFGPDEIEALSKYPTRDEAIATVVQIVLTPAQKLVGSILGPGRKVASLVKAIEEKLEKGETIAAAG